jgi:hypothetical protein
MSEAKRIQQKRIKGWRMPENTVYVGRPTVWGNPFKGPNAVRLYRLLWRRRWKQIERLLPINIADRIGLSVLLHSWQEHLPELRGKDLACWCRPDVPCHADVLLKYANAPERKP